jgi:putative SOS response-associated peptidase YedK
MNRTAWLQDRRMQKFRDVLSRWERKDLSALEAAEILGVSERQFRRHRRRYEEQGLEGLIDRLLGKASVRRVPVDKIAGQTGAYRAQPYIIVPCVGEVIQSSGPLHYAIVDGLNVRDSRMHNYPPRWNGAPNQDLLVIRRNHKTGEVSLDPLRWGLIPYWCKDPAGGRRSINAKCETVSTLPTFRDAYRLRRCIPVDGFYEWKAIRGQRAKQPYAIAMKDGAPFGIACLWENWKDPASGEWIRTFAVITTDANELVAEIHDRMPAKLAPEGYTRWLSDEPDP